MQRTATSEIIVYCTLIVVYTNMVDNPCPLSQRPWDALFIIFFVIHIPITLLVDSQVVFPRDLYPQILVDLVDFHVNSFQDFLCGTRPAWFYALCVCEIFLQVPFFFVATYAFVHGREWIRVPAIMYAAHTVTTLVPILAEFLASTLPIVARLTLVAIYLPFLLVPLGLLFRVSLCDPIFSKHSRRTKIE